MTSRVLIIEDREEKNAHIAKALRDVLNNPEMKRASTLTEAEDALSDPYDLIILDISMNINSASGSHVRGAVADLGGLELIEYMYLNHIETRVIIVTGFDFFRLYSHSGASELIGLDDLEARVESRIGDQLRGVIRYGSAGWGEAFRGTVKSVVRP